MVKLGDMRKEYQQPPLRRNLLAPNPMQQFDQWFQEALIADVKEANAVVLATANQDGQPSARIMLLKDYDENGFIFFTNYQSRKGIELQQNPNAALVFWWKEQIRQVRIEGTVIKADISISDQYFQKRDRKANIGVYASKQSQEIASRDELMERFNRYSHQFKNTDLLPRPEFWGGYRLVPESLEFWAGSENRLHDRFRYSKENGEWKIVRLAP